MRYFITMKEACQLVLEAGAIGKTGEVFIFDMGDKVFLKDLVQKMIQLSGVKINTDIKIVYTGLRAGEKLLEERLLGDEENIQSHDAKITISHPKPLDKFLVNDTIKRLEDALEQGEENELVQILKDAIPEYISHNSEFEKLDILRAAKVERNIME
jgi:FlaA1/EpsC-like NDP-sugar epimerase